MLRRAKGATVDEIAEALSWQRRVIQLASIVLFHLPSESDKICPVKKNVQLLMD